MPTLSPEQQLEAATMRRVSWRLMPFLLAAYLIAYIDRVNVGFAALQMNKAVGLDPKTYGWAPASSSSAISSSKCRATSPCSASARAPGSRAS